MPSIKGTSSVTDARARSKALKATRFPTCFSKTVDLEKINKPVLTQWIEQKVTAILGFDDEIVSSTAINLFLEGDNPDPRRAQLDLAGFLGEEESALFAKELWNLMIEAESSSSGIPRKLLEEKKKELSHQKASKQMIPAMLPAQQPQHASSRHRNPELNRFVQEAARRAQAARQMVGAPENGVVADVGAVVPVPIPVSPPHLPEPPSFSSDKYSKRSDRDRKSDRKSDLSKYDGDRKMSPREIPARSDLPPLPNSREGEGPTRSSGRSSKSGSPARGRGSAPRSARGGSKSIERSRHGYRSSDDRRGDDRQRRSGDGRDGRRYYSSLDGEIEELERRLVVLKKKVSSKREDYDEIQDLKDRIRELERRRHRGRDEEYRRRRPERRHRSRSRSRSSDDGSKGRRDRKSRSSSASSSSSSSGSSSSSSESTDSYGRKRPRRSQSGERGPRRSRSNERGPRRSRSNERGSRRSQSGERGRERTRTSSSAGKEVRRKRSPSTSSASSRSSRSSYSDESR